MTQPSSASQFLTFRVAGEEYGIDILKVQEIKGYTAVTPVPNAPPRIKGVMNLRGTVVPVLDLRAQFGLPPVEYTKFTVIIVVAVRARVLGVVVDAVSDVLDFKPDQLAPPPELGTGVDTTLLTGMAKAGERLVMLLDMDELVGAHALAA